jgi:lipoprotein signal peptidase
MEQATTTTSPPLAHAAPAWRSPGAVALFLFVAAALLAADLYTKHISFQRLVIDMTGTPPQPVHIRSRDIPIVEGWLHLHAIANQGAVFGLGQGKRWFFLAVSGGAVGLLLYLFAATRARHWAAQLLVALFLAGVLGNMYDRATWGFVRDMFFALPGFHWPGAWQIPFTDYPAPPERHVFPWIFNLADSYLCIGVAVVLIHAMIPRKNEPEVRE